MKSGLKGIDGEVKARFFCESAFFWESSGNSLDLTKARKFGATGAPRYDSMGESIYSYLFRVPIPPLQQNYSGKWRQELHQATMKLNDHVFT